MRKSEILNLSRQLHLEARSHCVGVNRTYLAVHEVLSEAFAADPGLVESEDLHAILSSRLKFHLSSVPAAA
ncbi:MAG: hypothetical protein ABL973_17745 [Micropepsaceae bacterium]